MLKIDNALRSIKKFALRRVMRSRKIKENVFKYTYTQMGVLADGGFKVTSGF